MGSRLRPLWARHNNSTQNSLATVDNSVSTVAFFLVVFSVFENGCKTRRVVEKFGGASRARTDDLIVANDALSQLSYSPTVWKTSIQRILSAFVRLGYSEFAPLTAES
jgi:hypothetical protein